LLACVAYAVPLMTPIIAKRFVSEWPTTLVEIGLQENVEIERITTHANSPRHCDVTMQKDGIQIVHLFQLMLEMCQSICYLSFHCSNISTIRFLSLSQFHQTC